MKNVGKLIIKCILALIPLWVICLFIAKSPLSYLSPDSVSAYWNKEFTQTKQDKNYDVVILGDSMAATSFMPELLSDSTINLALSGSSPVEGYYTLKDYLENNDAPSDVFISYMDYHLQHDDFTLSTCNQVHKFSIGDYYEIYRTIRNTGANGFEDINMDEYWDKAIASGFYLPSEYIASIINTINEGGRLEANKQAFDDVTVHAGRACKMTNDISSSSGIRYDDFTVSVLQGTYYKKLVGLCEDNQIKLHIIKLPLDVNTLFTEEYTAKVNGYYMNLLGDAKYAEFRWYPADYAVEWFWDDYHMNQHGSYRFSMQLKQDYADIWGETETSPRQMLALNDDIVIENEVPELFKWIDGKDYTVLIYSEMDDFVGYYNAYFKYDSQNIDSISANTYSVDIAGSHTVAVNNGTVTIDNNTYNWEDYNTNEVNIIIIDNANNKVVRTCSTSFNSGEGRFEKIQ